MIPGATSPVGLDDALLYNRRLWTIFLDAVMSENNKLPVGGSREYQAARRVRHGGDVLADDQAEAGSPDVDHQDQSRHRRRPARQSLRAYSRLHQAAGGVVVAGNARTRSGGARHIQSEPPAQMRYAFHIHLGGERPHIKQLFLGGDLQNRKIRVARRENRHPTARLRTDQASRILRLRRRRLRGKAFFADRGCRRQLRRI